MWFAQQNHQPYCCIHQTRPTEKFEGEVTNANPVVAYPNDDVHYQISDNISDNEDQQVDH